MAVRNMLLLFVLTTTCLAEVFQSHAGQERLSHDELRDLGSLGDASFDRFVNEFAWFAEAITDRKAKETITLKNKQ